MIDLKKEREAIGITQTALAERMGVTVRTIQGKEQGLGGSPTLSWLDKWAKALGKELIVALK
jgi:transcriptional regulator with XRE-family HTH domain